MPEIKALTGLRGVGACAVVAYHLSLNLPAPSLGGLFFRGYLAVDLFFILSGFVLARAYGDVFAHNGSARTYAHFVLRRFARLWPLHAAVLAALLAAQVAGFGAPAWPREVAANFLLVQAWGFSQSINIPSWFVSVEWGACLLFPLLVRVTLHSARATAACAAVAAVLALVAAAMLAQLSPHGRHGALDIYDGWSVLPMMRCLAGFTFGLLLHRCLQLPDVRAILGGPWPAPATMVLLVAGAAWGVGDGWLYVLLPVLVGALASGGGIAGRWLSTAAICMLGRLSFAIYLVHVPVFAAFSTLGLQQLWPLSLPVVGVVAVAGYVLIERPARALMLRSDTAGRPLVAGM